MKPLVSILIPCYNAESWLAQTIESALAQTWPNKEIIVVDDGSTDGSLSIARTYEAKNVKIISQANKGASSARNRALGVAKGEFIQYLDADDLLAPDKIERQMDALKESPKGLIASSEWARFYGASHHEAVFKPESLWVDMAPVDWLLCAWKEQRMMHPAAWLVPRSVTQQAGAWNESLSRNDDGEYFCRVVLVSSGIKFCRGARVYYRSGNGHSLSATASPDAYFSEFLSWKLSTDLLLSVESSARTYSTCATAFQRFIYDVYPLAPELRKRAEEHVLQLGGSDLQPNGGPIFYLMSKLLGWQRTKQIQSWAYGLGYGKAALGWKLHNLKTKMYNVLVDRDLSS